MCQVNIRCAGSGDDGAGAVVLIGGLVVVAAAVAVSVLSSVVAVVSTLAWAVAAVGGVGALGATGVYVLREVLAYRADRRDAEWVRWQLAARGISVGQPPAAVSGRPAAGLVLAGAARPVLAGRGGVR